VSQQQEAGVSPTESSGATDSPQEIVEVSGKLFTGPLPHPEIMAGYERVLPGSAERILRMTEKEQDARHRDSSALVQAGVKREREGLYLGGFLAAVTLIGSMILIGTGRESGGLAIILIETTVLAGVFLRAQHVRYRHHRRQNQR